MVFLPHDVKGRSADRRDILHRDKKYATFWKLDSKIWGLLAIEFLRAKAGTAVARLSHCNAVRLSATRIDQLETVQDRITKFLSSAAWNTQVSGSVKLFHKFKRGHL